jgi:MFS family permease
MQLASQRAATLAASLVGLAITTALGSAVVAAWAWRLPFLLGVLIVPLGLLIRRNLPETLPAPEAMPRAAAHRSLRPYLTVLIAGLLLMAQMTIAHYTVTYGTTYSLRTLHLPAWVAYAVTVTSSLTGIAGPLIAGMISDRIGRKPVLLFGLAAMILTVVPGFWLMVHYPSAVTVCAVFGLLSALTGPCSVPVVVALTEALPQHIRSGAVATTYALAISLFGGTAQFVVTWLMRLTGSPLAPGWYWMAATVLSLLVLPFLKETAPRKERPA